MHDIIVVTHIYEYPQHHILINLVLLNKQSGNLVERKVTWSDTDRGYTFWRDAHTDVLRTDGKISVHDVS
jgi:hypothetical protein